MLRNLQDATGNATGNATATVPATCVKDAECTAVAGYTKGCCAKYEPGSLNGTMLDAFKLAGFPGAAGKFCANDNLKG